MRSLLKEGKVYARVPVYKGIKEEVSLKTVQNVDLPLSDEEMEALEISEYVPDVLNAPIYAGIDTGFVQYSINGEIIAQSVLASSEDIRKKEYIDYLAFVLKAWCSMMREGIFSGNRR